MIPPLRYAGLVAVATLWTTLGAGTVLTGFDLLGERPLSYLGTQHPSALLFSGGLLVAALALVAFHRHVRARYRVTTLFSVAMLVGLAGQAVAALVPIGGNGAGHRVHTEAALVLGASLPLLMWRFAASQPAGAWRRLTYGLFWVEAAAVAVGLHLSGRMVVPVAEILPAAAFHLWIVAVTVSRTGIPRCRRGGPGRRPGFGTDGYRSVSPRLRTHSTAWAGRSRRRRPAPPRWRGRRAHTSRRRFREGCWSWRVLPFRTRCSTSWAARNRGQPPPDQPGVVAPCETTPGWLLA